MYAFFRNSYSCIFKSNCLNTSSMGNMLAYYQFNQILLKLIFNRKHITQRVENSYNSDNCIVSFYNIWNCTWFRYCFLFLLMFWLFSIDEICFLYFELLVIWQYWHTYVSPFLLLPVEMNKWTNNESTSVVREFRGHNKFRRSELSYTGLVLWTTSAFADAIYQKEPKILK